MQTQLVLAEHSVADGPDALMAMRQRISPALPMPLMYANDSPQFCIHADLNKNSFLLHVLVRLCGSDTMDLGSKPLGVSGLLNSDHAL